MSKELKVTCMQEMWPLAIVPPTTPPEIHNVNELIKLFGAPSN